MLSYVIRRLFLMIPTLIGITFLVFMIVALSPGGIGASLRGASGAMQSEGGANTRAIQEAYLDDRYGLDASPPVQYLRWLGRISPIKFGRRDQIDPTGEIIRYPKELRLPPLAGEWYAVDNLPEPPEAAEDHVFEHSLSEIEDARKRGEQHVSEQMLDERKQTYRRTENVYVEARAEYIKARAILEQALVDYAAAAELTAAIDKENKPVISRLRKAGFDESNPKAPRVREAGADALEALQAARVARENVAAVFRAKPYPEAGVPIIPGALSIAAPDFGQSFARSRPVIDLIAEALPVTLLLNFIAIPIIYFIAIPSGMIAATRQGTLIDVGSGALFVALWSIPIVWAGVLAIGYLAHKDYLGWFPVSGLHDAAAEDFTFLPSVGPDGEWSRGYVLDTLWHAALPVACLVYGGFAILSKQTRAAMLDNFNADYVRTAKAKGVSSKDVVLKHVFRNSLLPLITMFVTLFPTMLSGSVVIERIFTVPGMGNLVIEAIYLRDRELLLANVLMISGVNLLALLLADILYAMADPRITYD